MGNIHTCLSNAFEQKEIKMKPENNIVTDKTPRYGNAKSFPSKYHLFNRERLEIINEEENPECNTQTDKEPKDRSQKNITNEDNSKIKLQNSFPISDNKIKFNNIRKSDELKVKDIQYKQNINEDNLYQDNRDRCYEILKRVVGE